MKTLNNSVFSCIPLVLLLSTPAVFAQSGSEDYSIVTGQPGGQLMGQINASVNGGTAVQNMSCVPTATADALSYLAAYQEVTYDTTPFTVTPNTYTAVNALQSNMGTTSKGTSTTGQVNGLNTYLTTGNPAPTVKISGQVSQLETSGTIPGYGSGIFAAGTSITTANPSASFLANALNANAAVEVGILWGTLSGTSFYPSGGEHELALNQINLSSGTIGFVDPGGTSGIQQNGGVLSSGNIAGWGNFLYITYPTLVSGPDTYYDPDDLNLPNSQNLVDPDPNATAFGVNDGETAIIIDDTIETVPEPSTYALLGIGALGAFFMGRRRLVAQ
jgi:PEP-CTERM motif